MQEHLFDFRATRELAFARVTADIPASELGPIQLFNLSLNNYEKLCIPRLPTKVRRALNIVSAYRRWLQERSAMIALEDAELLKIFAASKRSNVWLPAC